MAFGYDGSIRIDTKLNGKGVKTGINDMVGNMNAGINKMLGSLGKLAAAIGVAFGIAAVVNFGKESVKAASQLSSALIGLQSIVEGQGRSFQQAQGFIQEYIKDGLVPMQDAVTAYKNLAMRGYSTEQIERTLIALKDASAFGRSAALSMGEAVSSATEGLRNENSILVDNAGVTKNVSMMWADYAKELGVGVQSLTKAQKIQAEVNGIMEETRYQTGDAAKVSETYAGQVAMLSFQFQQFKVALGEAVIPVAKAVIPGIRSIISALTQLANVFAQVTTLMFGGEIKNPAKDEMEDQKEIEDGLTESGKDAAGATGELAGATEGMGEASKEAAKEMKGVVAGFDDLNKLAGQTAENMDEASGELGGLDVGNFTGGGELFGGVTVNPEIVAFVDNLKKQLKELADILGRIWDVFQDAWDKNGAKVIEAAKAALLSIWELLKAIAKTFADVFASGAGERFLENIMTIIAGILNFIATLADQFKDVWDRMGEDLVTALFYALNSVLELVISIGSAFVEAWNSGVGVEILETIMSILTGIFNLIGIIANKIQEAWEANGNGVAIWTSILNIISDVLGFIDRLVAATVSWASELDLEPIMSSFRMLLESVESFVAVVLDSLAWAYENVLLPLAGWFIEEAAPAGLDLLSAAIEALTAVIESLQPFAIWLWENFLKPVAEWTGELFISAINLITDALSWFTEHGEALKNIIIGVFSAFALWKTIEFANYVKYIGALTHTAGWEALKNAISQVIFVGFAPLKASALSAFNAMKLLLITVWDQIKNFALLSVELAKQTVAWVAYHAKVVASTIAQWAQVAATTAWNAICAVATTLTTAFGAAVAFLTSPIGLVVIAIGALIAIVALLVKNWDKVKEAAGLAWEKTKEVWSAASGWFGENVIEPIKDVITGIIDFIKNAVEAAIKAIKSLFGNADSESSDFLNPRAIGASTSRHTRMLYSEYTIPQIPSAATYTIPKLAKGAVIPPNQEFMAILGDQRSGTNIEAPLSTIEQALRNVMAEQGGAGQEIVIQNHMNMDGREVFTNQQRIGRLMGRSLVTVGG